MKLGILGTGMIVKDLNTTIETFGIEEISILATEKTIEEAKALHVDHIYTDYDELLKSDVDTIYVALPNFLHYAFTKKALENGKNVICEKPFTSNYKEAVELIDLAKSKQLILLEAVTIHYMPSVIALKEKIKEIGDIKIATLNYSQYSSRYDAFKEGTILPAFDYHKSGGALYDINVYNVNFIVGLYGAPKAVHYLPNIQKGIDTSGILTLDYGTFKATLTGAKDCGAPVTNTLQGDQGFITIDTPVSRMTHFTYQANKQEPQVFDYNEDKHAMSYEFKEFIRIIDYKDYDKAYEMLEISKTVSKILNDARLDGGIVFDADKN